MSLDSQSASQDLGPDSSQAKPGSAASTCHSCNKPITGRCIATAVKCTTCGASSHMNCLINNFTSTYGGALKTSLQWLSEFLRFSNFRHVCCACVEAKKSGFSDRVFPVDALGSVDMPKLHNDIASLQSSYLILSDSISHISSQLADLKNSLQPTIVGQPSMEKDSQPAAAGSATNRPKPPSYAAIVSNDVSMAVKQAVAETFSKQRKVERINATIAVHGLPENGKDYQDLLAVFANLGCKAKILSSARIGKTSGKPRLLKVELQSAAEREDLLSATKSVKLAAPKIYITKWLPREEFVKLKQLWQKCDALNSKEADLPDGRKPFVVVSGRLMMRSADGKLKSMVPAPASHARMPRMPQSSIASRVAHGSPPTSSSPSISVSLEAPLVASATTSAFSPAAVHLPPVTAPSSTPAASSLHTVSAFTPRVSTSTTQIVSSPLMSTSSSDSASTLGSVGIAGTCDQQPSLQSKNGSGGSR